MQPTLYLMVGYPGAGKTTTAKVIHELTRAVHLSSDKVRTELFKKPTFSQEEHDELYKYLDQRTEELLRKGKSVIYDANLNRHRHRKDKYEICQRTGAWPVVLWLQTDKDVAKQRATHKSRSHLIPHHETASAMFDRISDLIEPPTPDEHPIIVNGTKVTPEYIADLLKLA